VRRVNGLVVAEIAPMTKLAQVPPGSQGVDVRDYEHMHRVLFPEFDGLKIRLPTFRR
jgi:hypothetical protein